MNRRQFYVLAMGSCIGNLAGFIGNALISDGTEQRFSVESVCYLWPQEVSLELKRSDTLCVLFDDSSIKPCGISNTILYISDGNDCIHGTCDGSNCDFIPTGNAIRFAGIVIVADVAAVILAYMRPLESENCQKKSCCRAHFVPCLSFYFVSFDFYPASDAETEAGRRSKEVE